MEREEAGHQTVKRTEPRKAGPQTAIYKPIIGLGEFLKSNPGMRPYKPISDYLPADYTDHRSRHLYIRRYNPIQP